MKFHLLYVSSVSACFELENTSPYYADDAFEVNVNGAPALQGVRTNVFSLFELQPGTEYTVAIGQDELTFSTKTETGCVNVRDFGAVGDGVADDTAAIQSAIHLCPRGGRVLVPAGTYAVRPLVLKSHMTLELRKDALLLAVQARYGVPPPTPRLVVVQGLPKGDRGELAVEMMTEAGADMVIANGADPEVLYAILEGAQVGTRFLGKR